ncbi:glutaredoxin domain-containing protein [Massilia sp. CF038]|uniref:glutaredoxin family protein n=1 Tax=Massilia sp. CF038 TaxID=1881045 RepID=UPI00091927ED|nr:glutaredoxin domain-containing protein [Massilia sp. CF038]SHG34559.1 Glutaredoxin [Massilia sp. CF038]
MLRIVFVICLAFGAFQFYKHGNPFTAAPVTDKAGKPLVILFTGPNCAEHCEGLRATLKARKVDFTEIDLAGPDGRLARKYGVDAYPTTMIGKRMVRGSDVKPVAGALAEAFGSDVLTRAEKMAMSNHFDAQGRPKVVLYGTTWCGYCAKQRALFAEQQIPFDDINVEASERGQLAYNALAGTGYPLTYVGYNRFDGFNDDELMASAAAAVKAR